MESQIMWEIVGIIAIKNKWQYSMICSISRYFTVMLDREYVHWTIDL